MIEDHDRCIKRYAGQVKSGTNAALRDFARDAMPALRERVKQARALEDKLRGK